jgi:hypothetical protein
VGARMKFIAKKEKILMPKMMTVEEMADGSGCCLAFKCMESEENIDCQNCAMHSIENYRQWEQQNGKD